MHWLDSARKITERRPVVLLRFDDDQWSRLRATRKGINEFTLALPHPEVAKITTPSLCVIQGTNDEECLYFGLISSRRPVSTLDSLVKIERVMQILPRSLFEMTGLMPDLHARRLQARLSSDALIDVLSPKLGQCIVECMASITENQGPMRAVVEAMNRNRRFGSSEAMQDDAVRIALKTFGISHSDAANDLELFSGRATALSRVSVREDSVIEHNARVFPGYELLKSDITGRELSHPAYFSRQT